MNLIDLTLRVDLRTAGEAQANLDKARSGHLGTHFDVMDKEFPLEYMEREAILDKHVAIIAIDFAGVRNGKEHTPTDQLCADRGTFIVENVCNLAAVLKGKKVAFFVAGTYPVNYVGTTGLPCRVVARMDYPISR